MMRRKSFVSHIQMPRNTHLLQLVLYPPEAFDMPIFPTITSLSHALEDRKFFVRK